ncbi:hypothetical protein HYT53_00445 [Candidatus Woesearchaeota archaeon]|nr:hypothetical protein [Candidatus Woesearchaeota archaeon]
MFDYFSKEKSDFLGKKDKSKKGCVDEGIKEIIIAINSKKGYYTTSSCAGRIVLLERLSGRKNESNWLFSSHNKIKFNEIKNHLKNQIKNEIWLKQEPLILHVRCSGLKSAKKLLDISRKIFRRAGIISLSEKKIVVEIIGSERIDAIIADKNFIADENYLKNLVKYTNRNFEENKRKSEKFLKIIRSNL